MSNVEKIEQDVSALSPAELDAFRKRFIEFDAEAWDRQIEEDIQADKLDALADQGVQSFHSGPCSPLTFPPN